MLDTACGSSILEPALACHRAVATRTGPVHAEGCVLSPGKRAAFSEAKLFDGGGRLLASATLSFIPVRLEK